MDSITQTVLAGTESVARAIGGAAESRLAKKERARKAWDKLAQNTQGLANWADEKAKEDDLRNLSDVVAASSIGGDYEKAIQALSQTPTKTATGAQEKLKQALSLRASLQAKENSANERILKMREMDLESDKNAAYKASLVVRGQEDQTARMAEAEKIRAAQAASQGRVEAYAPVNQWTNNPYRDITQGEFPVQQRPATDQEALARMSRNPNIPTELFVKMREAVSKESDRETDNTRLQAIAEKEAEQKDRGLELKAQEQSLKYGFKREEFDWKKQNDARKAAMADAKLAADIVNKKSQLEYLYTRLQTDVETRYNAMEKAFIAQKITEIGKDYRGQMNQLFDANDVERLRKEAEGALNDAIKAGVEQARKWSEEQVKTIQAAGGNVVEAPVDPKSLSTGDLVKKINEKLGKAGN